jgi:rare lipoprotein A
MFIQLRPVAASFLAACTLALPWPAHAERETGSYGRPVDRSGAAEVGKASFYGSQFFGRTMADGEPMDPQGDNAASKTLPLGTTARVTNLETGQSTVVVIQDRGPYVQGRIVDLSPASAEAIGLTREQGLARVEVAPIEVPLPGGGVKLGAGADPTRTMGGSAR